MTRKDLTIVKVQTDTEGSPTVLVYAKGRKRMKHQYEPQLAEAMGPLAKRYHYASLNDENGHWRIGRLALRQDW